MLSPIAPEPSVFPFPICDNVLPVDTFLEEVLDGLSQPQKTLPCKYFYDERGSQLFDCICDLEEYYLTRTELALMRDHAGEMADGLGPGGLLIEYGSGSSLKTRLLLNHLDRPAAYVPIDISREHLIRSAVDLAGEYPGLKIFPVCADYTAPFELPQFSPTPERKGVYFPGSTIGNFQPEEALRFLQQIADVCGPGGGLLIGVDLKKDIAVLEPAYNDKREITAEFNLNLLRRINRELNADFPVDRFRHQAIYNPEAGRIEMYLISRDDQKIHLNDKVISFRQGETILTEYSYKYSLEGFRQLAHRVGFNVQKVWTDDREWFSVQYLTVESV